MKSRKITVQIPATSANLGPGFDILGLALRWTNEVTFEAENIVLGSVKDLRSLRIDVEGEGTQTLPRNASNLVIKAAARVFETVKRWPTGLRVKLINRIPLSRGLGSSAAATLGGIVAANILLGKPLDEQALLNLAVRMEGHPDNIVPAFAGGLCVSGVIHNQVRYVKFDLPTNVRAVVCSPEKPLPTVQARRVLPSQIPFNAAVFTASRVAFLLGAFLKKKYEWLDFAMEDVLHQPSRARLVPGLMEVIEQAKRAGAYGCALSGAGSSVIAFCRGGATPAAVGESMRKAFLARGIASTVVSVAFENQGIRS